MSSSSFVTVIALNNRGIGLFARGGFQNLQSASQCFRGALRILKQNMLEERKSLVTMTTKRNAASTRTATTTSTCSNDNNNNNKKPVVGVAPAKLPRTTKGTISPLVTTSKTASPAAAQSLRSSSSSKQQRTFNLKARLDQLSHFITTRPIKIEVKEDSSDSFAYRSSLCTSIITFNLALAFHLMGIISDADKSSRYWRCALAYYEVTFSLRAKLASRSQTKKRKQGSMLDLATANNMAVLNDQMGNASRARGFFRILATQVSRLDSSQRGVADAKGFITNLLLVDTIGEQVAASAAA